MKVRIADVLVRGETGTILLPEGSRMPRPGEAILWKEVPHLVLAVVEYKAGPVLKTRQTTAEAQRARKKKVWIPIEVKIANKRKDATNGDDQG